MSDTTKPPPSTIDALLQQMSLLPGLPMQDDPDPSIDPLAQLLQAKLSKDPALAAKQRRLLEKLQEPASDQPPGQSGPA